MSVVGLMAMTAIVLCVGAGVEAATLSWKGHTWQLTSGGMAGVCQGDPKNVTVDANGYLHLRISNSATGWTASEMFTTDRLGFGTYQWQVDGPIDSYDKNVVLGLFPYGPAAGIGADGTNEIDIEYSRWGQAKRSQWRLDRLPGLRNDNRRAQLHVLARAGDALDVALRLVGHQHRERSFDRATTGRRNDGAHQELDVRAGESDGQRPPAGAAAGDESLVLRLTALRRQPGRDRHSRFRLRPGQRRGRRRNGGRGWRGRGGAGGLGGAGGGHGGAGGGHGGGGQAGAGGATGGSAGRAGGSTGGAGGNAGGAAGKAGSAGATGGSNGTGGASGSAGSSGGAMGTAGSGGAPETAGHSGSTGASGSSSGCACALAGSDATWPATSFWSFVVLALLSRAARRSPRRNGRTTRRRGELPEKGAATIAA